MSNGGNTLWTWREAREVTEGRNGRWIFGDEGRHMAIGRWGSRNRRWTVFLLLLLCSPVLIPLLCLSCPLLCIAAFCPRFGPKADVGRDQERGGPGCSSKEGDSGRVDGPVLLQQYLEDQLRLVGSIYGCDEDEAEEIIQIIP